MTDPRRPEDDIEGIDPRTDEAADGDTADVANDVGDGDGDGDLDEADDSADVELDDDETGVVAGDGELTGRSRRRFFGRRAADDGTADDMTAEAVATGSAALGRAPRREAVDELPYVDDRVSRIWVLLILAVFGAIFLYGLLFGHAGMLTTAPAPPSSPPPSLQVTPGTSPTGSASPTTPASASPRSSPSAPASASPAATQTGVPRST